MATDGLSAFPLRELTALDDGRMVEWEARGSGEPLLWIEGGPGLPAHLARPEAAALSDRFRVHLVNAPGCGRTSAPAGDDGYSLDAHVRFFDDARQALELGRVMVMGHSWGGLVAQAMALAVPEAVARLVLIDSYAGDASISPALATAERDRALDRVRSEPWFGPAVEAFGRDPGHDEAAFCRTFGACWPLYFADPGSPRSAAHIERLRRELRWNLDVARAWEPEPPIDLLPDLARIQCPALVIVGEHDWICGPAWNRPIAEAMGARYVEVAGTGHLPQYEAPDRFRAAIDDWLTAG